MALKISVCVSGQMRALEAWHTLKPYLSSQDRQTHVFLHTWHQPITERVFRFYDPKLGQWSPLVHSNEDAIETLKPTNYLFEQNITEVVDPCRGSPPQEVTRHRVLSMWRGQQMAASLAQRHASKFGRPDVMCRTRSDLWFESDPFKVLGESPPPEGVVFVPEGNNGGDPELPPTEALNDWFGFAAPETFIKFTSLYGKACEYFKDKPTLFPEVMLKYHVDLLGLTVVRFPLSYRIHRV